MNAPDPGRFKIQTGRGRNYLLDAFTHQAFELNETAVLIAKDLLKGKLHAQVENNLSLKFSGALTPKRKKEARDFMELFERLLSFTPGEMIKSIPPITKVTFSVTNRCNLKCLHCLGGSTLKSCSELPFEKIESLAQELKRLGLKSVSIFGGEPLIRKDFFEIIDLFSDLKIDCKVNTNGTLVTEGLARQALLKGVSLFTVSLDGSSPEVQDKMRGKGSFSKAVRGIKHLVEAGNKVILSTTVNKINFEDILPLARFAKSLGVSGIRFNDVHFGGMARCHTKALRLKATERLKAMENVREAALEFGDFVTGSIADVLKILSSKTGKAKKSFPFVVKPCGAAMGSLCIRGDGGVTPCEILWDQVAGNLHQETLKEIYYHSQGMNEMRMPLILSREDIPGCHQCQYLSVCFSGHRCAPYFYPGRNLASKAKYACIKE